LRVRLLGFARRVRQEDVAEDLVQETFVVLTGKYSHVVTTEDRVRLGIEILRKKMAAHWRKTRRRGEDGAVDPAEAGSEVPDGGDDPEEAAHRRLLVERLRAALPRLRGHCRDLMRLKLEDRTFPEIAEILGAKLNTVYSWDHRCTNDLRTFLRATEVRQ
jgi:RNA polymerase sigma factor (sigma-70 family)